MDALIWQLRRPVLAVAAFSLVLNLLLLAPALFMLQVFDRVLASGSRETLWALLLGTALALALAALLDYVRGRLQGVVGNVLGDGLMPLAVREVIARGADASRALGRGGAELLRDVATTRSLFSAQALLALFDAPWALVYIAVIWLAHPALGAAAGVAALLMLALAWTNDRVSRRQVEALQQRASGAQRTIEAAVANSEATAAMGMTGDLIRRWQVLNDGVRALQRSTARRTVSLAALARLMRQLVQVAVLTVGAFLVITQAATAGVMVATTIVLGRALAPVEQLVASWRLLIEGRAALRRLREALGQDNRHEPAMRLPPPEGGLSAEGLMVRAPGTDRLILAGVSFALQPGESLAVLGPSGAGKSTLLRALAGLWRPAAGTVRIDGADIARWPHDELGPFVGYVPQDVELFEATVAENIARLQPQPDSGAVIAAAQLAGVHELILALPKGYDTPIRNADALLSPGQRQRIAIARALFGQPPLMLLDEPNSNLDGDGEQRLGQTLAMLHGKATIVVVTHRTSLVQHVDKLMVLEGGRIRHFGPHDEVLQAMQTSAARVVPIQRLHGDVG